MTADASATRTTQAVILARGLGTRMRRDTGAALDGGQANAAASGAKGMMPFARPFLD
jgi:glucose-1-phosphate thymidylyltransferase